MPDQEVAFLPDKVVLWPFAGGYDQFGQPRMGAPIELNARWLTKKQEAKDAKGNTVMLDGTAIVDRRVDVGGLMWLGALKDLPPGTSFQGEPEGLMSIVRFNETSDIKGRAAKRVVGLMRYRDST